jgi:DNA helicase II / ATP-dependent DNA helicase PcrA
MTDATFAPSAYQQRFFDWVETGRGSAVLVAVAGSGKTTSVIEAQRRIPEGKAVLLLAFNAIIAAELNERLATLRKDTGRAFAGWRASTFHSLGLGAVRKFLSNIQLGKPDGGKMRNLLREFLDEADLDAYGDFVSDLVSKAKGEGIGALTPDLPGAWFELIRHHDLTLTVENSTEERAVEIARQALNRSEMASRRGIIDFDDMLYLPIKWKLRLFQQDWVFVDEAQDTNPVRRALAKLALRPGGRLVAVGDPKQAIYGFTGASHDAIDLIKREFNAVELPLTVSYRCARKVVQAAQEIVPYLEAAPNAIEGTVDRGMPLPEALKHLGSHDAILCRQTAPLIKCAYELIAKGVGCHVLGREIGAGLVNLVKKMRAKGLPQLEEKLIAFREREVARFTARGEEGKAEGVADRVECVFTVIGHLAEPDRSIPKLIERISTMFSDANGVLVLSTVHKAKGREWERVAILRPDLMPSKWARQDWQMEQEKNLIYVAITRTKRHLMFLAV